jgi:YD repeat-containing protein
LTKVVEPNGAAAYYAYDAIDNLLCAAQDGGTGGAFSTCAATPATWRPRTFTYDSLSRLITANNPENGTVCYGTVSNGTCSSGYDVNGNLGARTDARGITVSYNYDALNRMTAKSASDGSFSYAYFYDASDGNSETNPVGRLTFASNQVNAAKRYSYDPMGRVNKSTYCVPQDCKYDIAASVLYDLAGDLTQLTYPDGRVVTQGYNSAGQLSAVNFAETR